MNLKYKLNDIVTVKDPDWKNLYGKELEIVGAGEDALSKTIGFIVQINQAHFDGLLYSRDDLYYFVLEEALTPTGKKGTRKKIREGGGIHIPFPNGEYTIILPRDLNDLDAAKPYTYAYKDALVLKFRQTYELIEVLDFIREMIAKLDEVQERKVVFDFSDWKYLGYLGGSLEVFELVDALQERGKEVTFCGLKDSNKFMFEALLGGADGTGDVKMPANYPTLEACLKAS